MEERAKKHKLTQGDCDTARLMMERQQTLKEIAKVIRCDPSTVGKIRACNYDLQTYLEYRKKMNKKTKDNKLAREAGARRLSGLVTSAEDEERDKKILEQLMRKAEQDRKILEKAVKEPEVPGQMRMELPEAEEPKQDEQAKMMRFFAAQVDKIAKRLDVLIDVLQKGGGNG